MGVAATSMTRFVLLLLGLNAVECLKQQWLEQQESQDDSAVNIIQAARHPRDTGCAQHRQLNYPCNNQIIDASESICSDYGTAIRNSYKRNDYTNCCCYSTCSYNNNITSGGVGASGPLNVMWSALSSQAATLTVDWKTPSSGGGPIGYQVWIFLVSQNISVSNYDDQKQRCICLPPSTTSYRVSVAMTRTFYIHIKLFSALRPGEQPCDNDYDNNNVLSVTDKIPSYCWELEGASVEKCGPMFPSAPQNLSATSIPVNESTVMLRTSWLPPAQYNPDITMYAIRINGGGFSCISGTTLQYVTIGSADVQNYKVEVAASSGVVTSNFGSGGICIPPCCFGCNCFSQIASITHIVDHSTSSKTTVADTTNPMTITLSTFDATQITSTLPTQSPVVSSSVTINVSSRSTTGDTTHSILVIVLCTLITATIPLVALVVILIIVYLYQRKKQAIYDLVTPRVSESIVQKCQPKAFIVTDKNLESVRQLCHHLAEYGIDPVYYQYVENDRTDGPGRLGIPVWAEKWFKESSIVLFVCNEGFSSIWDNIDGNINNARQDSYAEIISTTKLLFCGCIIDNNMSKFAAVLLQESDDKYIPDLLRNIKSFSVGKEEDLARYILQIPTHAPPCRVNNN